jgi:hypothetical protein
VEASRVFVRARDRQALWSARRYPKCTCFVAVEYFGYDTSSKRIIDLEVLRLKRKDVRVYKSAEAGNKSISPSATGHCRASLPSGGCASNSCFAITATSPIFIRILYFRMILGLRPHAIELTVTFVTIVDTRCLELCARQRQNSRSACRKT